MSATKSTDVQLKRSYPKRPSRAASDARLSRSSRRGAMLRKALSGK